MTTPSRLVISNIEPWRMLRPEPDAEGIAWLDMSGVEELDSAGIALLVQWAAELVAVQGKLTLTHLDAKQLALVKLCGVDTLLLEPDESPV